jgi:transcriptional regulator of arginine metabolism
MEKAANIIVVKTITGTAAAVGEAIDGMNLHGILGSVAGDNAVLVVVREGHSASDVLDSLRNIAGM